MYIEFINILYLFIIYLFSRQNRPKPLRVDSDDSDESDHEEEFYYTEIEVSVDTVTQTFADMHTSSPPQLAGFYGGLGEGGATVSADHDYQKKVR